MCVCLCVCVCLCECVCECACVSRDDTYEGEEVRGAQGRGAVRAKQDGVPPSSDIAPVSLVAWRCESLK